MAAQNYDEALRRLLVHEGGYSNDPGDPGGPTKYGITIIDYRKYINPRGTANDVKNMTVDQAKIIYRAHYANPLHFDDLPSGVDYAVFDYGVNSGISRAAKVLQRLVGAGVDGVIGNETLTKTAKRNPKQLINAICDERLRFLQGLSTWRIFGKGWGRRVSEVRAAALAMADKTLPMLPPSAPMGDAKVAKGQVTEPKAIMPVAAVTGSGTAIAAASSWQWFVDHLWSTGLIVAGIVLAVVAIIVGIKRWHKSTFDERQTALPTDLKPLPEVAQ